MGAIKYDGRNKPLADGANTLDSTDAFPLPGPNGGILLDLSIFLGSGQGPVQGSVIINRGGSTSDAIVVTDQFTLRASALTGSLPDAFTLDRPIHYPGASTLRIYLRNDSGAAVGWGARWATEIA